MFLMPLIIFGWFWWHFRFHICQLLQEISTETPKSLSKTLTYSSYEDTSAPRSPHLLLPALHHQLHGIFSPFALWLRKIRHQHNFISISCRLGRRFQMGYSWHFPWNKNNWNSLVFFMEIHLWLSAFIVCIISWITRHIFIESPCV